MTDLEQTLLTRLDEYLNERESALVKRLITLTEQLHNEAEARERLESHLSALSRQVGSLSERLASLSAQVQALQRALKI